MKFDEWMNVNKLDVSLRPLYGSAWNAARTMTPESEPPNTHRPVLCFDGYNYFKGNYDGTWNSEYGSHLGITHWMELPEVPG